MAKITYKIDRLSNASLQLGLKTDAVLTGTINDITSSKILKYSSDVTSNITNDAHLTNKKYVDTKVSDLSTELYTFLKSFIQSGDRIQISNTAQDEDKPSLTIALGAAYESGTGKIFSDTDTKKVVSSIEVDKYGTITQVNYKAISTSDLDNAGKTFDNYSSWQLKVGTAKAEVTSSWRAEGDESPVVPVEIASDGSILSTLTTEASHLLTLKLNINPEENYPLYVDSSAGLSLRTIPDFEPKESGLYKIAIDKFGRITAAAAVAATDLSSILPKHGTTTDGIVAHINTAASGNVTSSISPDTTYFYTSDAKWAKIPYDKIALTVGSGATAVSLLGTSSTGSSGTGIRFNNLKFTPDSGTLEAGYFKGNGSYLTNISAEAVDGELGVANIPVIDQNKINFNLTATGASVFVTGDGKLGAVTNPTTPTENTNFVLTKAVTTTGVGITTAPQWVNIKNLVTDIVAGEGGLTWEGTIGSAENNATYTDIPTTFTSGNFYKIVTSGTYAGMYLEAGDTIFAIKDSDPAYATADDSTKQTYWSVLQGNLDHAVTYSSSTFENGILPIKASGTQIIGDAAGLTATKSNEKWSLTTDITGNAGSASKLASAVELWGHTFDGTASISGDLSNVGNITVSASGTHSIGTQGNPFTEAYITNIHGTVDNATEAASVAHSLRITDSKVFDGSADIEIDPVTDFGIIKTISVGAATGEGNAITEIAASANDNGVVTLTPTKAYFVKAIESSLFTVSVSAGTATFSRLTTEKDGAIYSSAAPLPTLNSNYGFGGILTAYDLKVVRDGLAKRVAVLGNGTETALTDKYLLVADSAAADYGFKKTNVSISNTPTWTSDTQIPTASAINTLVSGVQESVSEGSVKCIKLNITDSSLSTSNSIPSGAVIDHIDVHVKTAYDATSSLSISVGSTTYVTTSDIDLSTADDVFSYPIHKETATGGKISGNISAGTTIGAVAIYVYFVQPLN